METSRGLFAEALGAEAGFDIRRAFCAQRLAESVGDIAAGRETPVCIGPQELLQGLVGEARERLSIFDERFRGLAELRGSNDDVLAIRSKAALELAPFLIGTQYLLHGVVGNWNNESSLRTHGVARPCIRRWRGTAWG